MAKSVVSGAKKNIHQRNFIYHFIHPTVKAQFFHFYGKMEVYGVDNIPRKAPVIFAPNHQMALMDALIVLFKAPQDVVFLARADIFRKRFLAFLLNSLKMLPVFRQRDGASELSKNQEIFDISVNVLKNRHYLCLMPEGNHGHQRKLRPLVKGIFRIAFKAQEAHGEEPFVKILPVGMDVGDYIKHNQPLLLHYGKPIEVSEFWAEYEENNARAINALRSRLAEEMKPLMIHIGTDEHYEAFMGLRTIFNDRMREIMEIKGSKLEDRFRADKEMIARLDAALEKDVEKEEVGVIAGKVGHYDKRIRELRIRDWVVRDEGYGVGRSVWRFLSLLFTFPVFLFGFITNVVPYLLPVRLVRNVRDPQFHSSIKVFLAILILFPLYYILLTLLVGIFTGPWWIWLLFLVSLPFMGKASLVWYLRWKKTVRGSWFNRQVRRKAPDALELVDLRREIVGLMDRLMEGMNG